MAAKPTDTAADNQYGALLSLPQSLSEEFCRTVGEAFPELSPLDLLWCSAEIRRATHDATMSALDRLRQQVARRVEVEA